MKLNADNINYYVNELISQELGCVYEYADPSDEADHQRLVSLGFIQGVLRLADKLKEAANALN